MPKFCLCITKQEEDVKVLNYSHCSLKDVPNDVFNTERTLEELYLDANQIRDLPRELFYCHGVRKLNLSDNEITFLPPALGSLINLEQLDISKNGILDVPENIRGCKVLCVIEASVNPLGKLPDGFTQLPNLSELFLNDAFLDYLPGSFGRLSKLKILELRENHLKSLPKSMSRLTLLQRLDIGNNDFTEMPDIIGSLVNLRELWCDMNGIKRIPPEFGNLKQLMYLDASKNRVEVIPAEVEGCANLTDLHLSTNILTELPDTIGRLSSLSVLKVDDNQLTSLPFSIGGLVSLGELDVSANDLEELPRSIGLLRRLHTLLADENLLLELPSELGSCSGISILSVRSNKLTYVPDEIGRIPRLRVLNLADNEIRAIPYSFTKLKQLQAMWLAENQAKPLIRLQADIDVDTGKRILTCYLLPQQPLNPDDMYSEHDSFQYSTWDDERAARTRIKFDFGDQEDPELVEQNSNKTKLRRTPTPFPKEMKERARHHRNVQLRKSSMTNGDINGDITEALNEGSHFTKESGKSKSPIMMDTHYLYKMEKEKLQKDKARMQQHREKSPDKKASDVEDGMPNNVSFITNNVSDKHKKNMADNRKKDENKRNKNVKPGVRKSEDDDGGFLTRRDDRHGSPSRSQTGSHMSQSSNNLKEAESKDVNTKPLQGVPLSQSQLQKYKDQAKRVLLNRLEMNSDTGYMYQKRGHGHKGIRRTPKTIREYDSDTGHRSDTDFFRKYNQAMPSMRDGYTSDWDAVNRYTGREGSNFNLHDGDGNFYKRSPNTFKRNLSNHNDQSINSPSVGRRPNRHDWRNELLSVLEQKRQASTSKKNIHNENRYSPTPTVSDDVFTHDATNKHYGQQGAAPTYYDPHQPQYRPPPPYRKPSDTEPTTITQLGEPPNYHRDIPSSSIHPAFRDQVDTTRSIHNMDQSMNDNASPYGQRRNNTSQYISPAQSPYNERRYDQHRTSENRPNYGDNISTSQNRLNYALMNSGQGANTNNQIHSSYGPNNSNYAQSNYVEFYSNKNSDTRSNNNQNVSRQPYRSSNYADYSDLNTLGKQTKSPVDAQSSLGLPPSRQMSNFDQYRGERSYIHVSKPDLAKSLETSHTSQSHVHYSPDGADHNGDVQKIDQSKSVGYNSYGAPVDSSTVNAPPPLKTHEISNYEDVFKFKSPVEPSSQVSSSTDSGYHGGPHIYERLEFERRFPGGYSPPSALQPPNRAPPGPPSYDVAHLRADVTQMRDSGHGSFDQQDTHMFMNGQRNNVVSVVVNKNPGLGFSIAGGIGSHGNPFRPSDQGIFVTKVQPDGPAISLLRPGDKIIEVNGLDFVHIDHTHAVTALKNSNRMVSLRIERDEPLETYT